MNKLLYLLLNKTNIEQKVNIDDFDRIDDDDEENVNLIKEQNLLNGDKYYEFEVNDNYYFRTQKVAMITNNKDNKIIDVSCDCRRYKITNSCEHICEAILMYRDKLFSLPKDEGVLFGELLINKYENKNVSKIKKEVQVELSIELNKIEDDYYYYPSYHFNANLYIGEQRLYKVGNKINSLKNIYYSQEGTLKFGKEFTYNPEKHYFSKESEMILTSIFKFYEKGFYNNSVNDIKKLLLSLENSKFTINGYLIDKINKGFPVNTKLSKNNDQYKLSFDLKNVDRVINDYELIMYKGKMYRLDKKEQELLIDLNNLELDEIIFNKNQISQFSNGILKLIKNNIEIAEDVEEIKLAKNIQTELYFDLRNKYISCDVKLKYDNETINYFDKNSNLVRDVDYENTVINDLQRYEFNIKNNKIQIDNLEKMVEFIENGLEELAQKYVVFTTEKFKNAEIKKKTNITSTFKIGQDNILNYSFDLAGIDNSEIVNIFKEIKNKNKYYRLKNGDILSLEDENLKQLENLSEELELTDEEIINGKGTLQKYRAIYLDSLKDNKYQIIKTDNLFNNFIDNFYKYKDCNLTLSKKELNILRDYQVTGVKWLYNLDKTGFGGILADEMGLGKTIQTIYYIKQILKDDAMKKILIVVPTSLAYNWEKEFNMYASEIKKSICVGKKETRQELLKNINNTNVIITTYGLLREDYDLYKELQFHAFIIDEAQNIKNNLAGITKCVKGINSTTKFALTGTPLENSVLELWSIFDFIMPGYLSNLTKFQSKYKIKDYNDDADRLLKGLSAQINPFISRRKKSEVVKELPAKLVNDIYIDLDEKQKILYAAESEKVKKQLEEAIQNGGMSQVRFVILQLLTKLRQLCIDPKILYENYDGKSNKIDTLINIVNEYIQNGHKILIFSSFKTGLNVVKENLEKEKIKTFMIDGSVSSKKRMEMVEEFNNNDSTKVFLVMLKSGGTGLNLTGADIVIHLDLWWNPQAENQATDRAHRIGQTKNVEVIHLIMKGTIEEKILELQNKKRILSDKLIDGESRTKNVLSELSEEDIKNLLSFENKD